MTIEYCLTFEGKTLGTVKARGLPRVGDEIDITNNGLIYCVVRVAHKVTLIGKPSDEYNDYDSRGNLTIVEIERKKKQ